MSAMKADMLHEQGEMEAFDDVSNEPLVPHMVMKARAEELDYFNSMGVYEYAKIDECWKLTGKQPIGTRWIDVNKGDSLKPNYRSRLVAKEYKVDVRPDLFAATPPPNACDYYYPKRPRIRIIKSCMLSSAERTFTLDQCGRHSSSCQLKILGPARKVWSAS